MNKRLESLDALRGFDMLFIMGLATLVYNLCCLFPNGGESWLAHQMQHVPWHGLAHHDTIFPLFLFIAGMTFPFSLANKREKGIPEKKIWLDVLRRGLMLVFLGLVYQGFFQFKFASLRFPSVLGRIGLAWMFAAMVWLAVRKTSWRIAIAAACLIGYWVLHMFPAPDAPAGADLFSKEGALSIWIDRMVMPGHLLQKGVYDPEGIAGTVPAIATALLGMFTGAFVRLPEERVSGGRKVLWMLGAAVVLLAAGLLWSTVFPINKALWSSSFVLVVGAYSVAMFALFYWLIDVKGWRKWTTFFKVVGMNSITIYLAQRIIKFGGIRDFFFGGLAGLFPEKVGNIVLDLGYIAICWLFLFFLYKKKVFLKV